MSRSRLLVAAALVAASALTLAGCVASADAGTDRVRVVASTNVYGQIAQEIGGDAVDVTSIVASAAQDPHSFEPSAHDRLAISRADLVIENGGGYDAFVDALVDSSGVGAPVVTAVDFSPARPENDGHDHDHENDDHDHVEGFNEHVWYDPHTIERVAEAVAEELTTLRPDDADAIAMNLAAFTEGIGGLKSALGQIEATDAGTAVFVTEPLPGYLVAAAGLTDIAPAAFSEAVEAGQDVPPAALIDARGQLDTGEVRVVIANAQTGGAETREVVDDAKGRGIPVIEFAETLPAGQTYLSWMDENVVALADALAR